MITDPVVGKEFFGRNEVLKLLNKRVEGLSKGYRQNIAVLGEPCLGKTSLLHQFIFSLKDDSSIPLYIDVRLEPFYDFINRYLSTFLFVYLKAKVDDVPHDLERLIESAQKHLPKTVDVIKQILKLSEKKLIDEAYKLMFDLPTICKQDDEEVKFILIMDEFQNLGNFKIKNAFSILGQRIMIQHNTMYVVASSHYESAKKIMEKKLSLLFGQFHTIVLDKFSHKTSKNYIREKLFPIRIKEKYIKFLIYITSGHPFFLNIITDNLKNIGKIQNIKNVTLNDILGALNYSLFDSRSLLSQYLSNQLDKLPLQEESVYLLILLAIADNKNRNTEIKKFVEKHYHCDIKKPLKVLEELDFIEKTGRFYKFKDSLFGFWLKYVYQAKFSSVHMGIVEKTNYFKKNVEERFMNFLSNQQKSLNERIISLFESFSNDILPINGKRKNLPKFDNVYLDKIGDSDPYIFGYSEGKVWICCVKEDYATQDDIQDFIQNCKRSRRNICRKVFIPANGMHLNAKILAKEKNIFLLELTEVNKLLEIYGKDKIIKI